jgi:hypothetical protein
LVVGSFMMLLPMRAATIVGTLGMQASPRRAYAKTTGQRVET